jgi:hypothetical protein
LANLFRETRKYRKIEYAWQEKYDALAPKAGDEAPDFELTDVTGEHTVCLSDYREDRPVGLVFGSWT